MPPVSPSVPRPSASAFVTIDRAAARTPDGRTLFENLSLALGRERTGLVGRNGAGKTTLLRLIAGDAKPVEGAVARTGSIGLLTQAPEPVPSQTVADVLGVSAALAVQTRLLAGQGDASDLAVADWTLDDRLAQALGEVGLSGLAPDRAIADLSGGEQTRLRLARLLLDAPDLILLDEPTNNMDADARALVSRVLERWAGGAVVVSHDRALLRQMDRIVELSALGAAVYGGNYDLYAARKAEERAAAERGLATAEAEVDRTARDAQRALEKKARRDRAGRRYAASGSAPKILLGAMAERAENSSGRAGLLAARQREQADAALRAARDQIEQVRTLHAPLPPSGLATGKLVLAVEEAVWRAPEGRVIVGPVSLRLTGPERLAITGPNGAGKTTLLRLITGGLEPATGRVQRPVAAALMDQQASILTGHQTLLENFLRLNPGSTPHEGYGALARFLFRNASALRMAGTLSGGERLRAALACVLGGAAPPQLLVLDEPTNHLDLDSIAAIESGLRGYDGALVVVSHDPDFLEAITIQREVALTPAVLPGESLSGKAMPAF